jgi:tetratricopeptide (TPR) repeat protein
MTATTTRQLNFAAKGLRSEHLSKIDRASGHNDREIAYDNKGQHDRAIQDYDEAIRLAPTTKPPS